MASVTFNRKSIEKHFKLSNENVEKIRNIGIPVESLDLDDITIEVLANRPDLFSSSGFIRSVKNYFGKNTKDNYEIKKTQRVLKVDSSAPKEWCNAYACCVTGLSLDEESLKELIQLQEKLANTLLRNRKLGAIGVYPLDKLNFPIKLEGKSPDSFKFQPLESNEQMTGKEILEKHLAGKNYSSIIQNFKVFPVFTDSMNQIISMPPIINAENIGRVTLDTKSVFIEASGKDIEALKLAITILSTYLSDMGGKIESCTCIQHSGLQEVQPNLRSNIVKLSRENTNKLLGLNLTEKEISSNLKKMGFAYKQGKVEVPAWRKDIMHEVDLIEEVAIGYGYENLIPEIPNVFTIGQESMETRFTGKIRDIAVGLGLLETLNYHLIKEQEANWFNEKNIELEKAKTEYKLLRTNLITPLLRVISENKDKEYPQNLFEIGTVFSQDTTKKSETGIKEKISLAIACTPSNSTQLKQILDTLMSSLHQDYSLEQIKKHGCIEGRSVSIIINKKHIGTLAEIHPETLKLAGCKLPVSFLELDLSEIYPK